MIIDSATHQYEGVVFNVLIVDMNTAEWRSTSHNYAQIGCVANLAFVVPVAQFQELFAMQMEQDFMYGTSRSNDVPRGLFNVATV